MTITYVELNLDAVGVPESDIATLSVRIEFNPILVERGTVLGVGYG